MRVEREKDLTGQREREIGVGHRERRAESRERRRTVKSPTESKRDERGPWRVEGDANYVLAKIFIFANIQDIGQYRIGMADILAST